MAHSAHYNHHSHLCVLVWAKSHQSDEKEGGSWTEIGAARTHVCCFQG